MGVDEVLVGSSHEFNVHYCKEREEVNMKCHSRALSANFSGAYRVFTTDPSVHNWDVKQSKFFFY